MPVRTSTLARRTTCSSGSGRAAARLTRSRRRMFSTSTTASSTSSPIAMASPPSVMTLIDWPSHCRTSTATASDSGIAVSVISVVRADSRNANSTMATMIAPSRSACATLPTAASMKSAWRNSTCGASSPGGRPAPTSASAASTARVSATVSACGCLCTPRITAGRPLWPASPRLSAGANETCATWPSSSARPSRQATARPASWPARSSPPPPRPRWRIRYSRPARSMKPPPALPAKPRRACSICVSETPNCAMRAVSGATRSVRTSPPIGMTWATPGIASSRGRSTKSAQSRACIDSDPPGAPAGAAAAACSGSAISRISPMIEVTGPITGTTPGGSCSRTSASRSATSWRLR